jgi:glucokinase
MILAADIGGTKTVLALFSPESGVRAPLKEETFPSARYPDLESVVSAFTKKHGSVAERAVFGVSGPVVEGKARITNLPWVVEEKKIRRRLKIPSVRLLNDLEALASAVPVLEPSDLRTLNRGNPEPGGAIAVIAPGTGLGEAFLTLERWGSGSRYRPRPSEGGHADFAPHDPLEVELLSYLHKRFSHVSYEKVCSGPGIHEIYSFLKATGRGEEPDWLAGKLGSAADPTPVIVDAALSKDRPCGLCLKALHLFCSILGAEAGNLALKVLATKGVYLGGGIPPAILPALEKGSFMHSFQDKGRMSDLLSNIPVHVIKNDRAGLMGAAHYGLTECI